MVIQNHEDLVKVLEAYFERKNLKHIDGSLGASKTGWDLVFNINDHLLCIEVKYFRANFSSEFQGLLWSLFSNRNRQELIKKYFGILPQKYGWAFNITKERHKNEKEQNKPKALKNFLEKIEKNYNLWNAILEASNLNYFYFVDVNEETYEFDRENLNKLIKEFRDDPNKFESERDTKKILSNLKNEVI